MLGKILDLIATSLASFQLNGSIGVLLKDQDGNLLVRTPNDDGDASLIAAEVIATAGEVRLGDPITGAQIVNTGSTARRFELPEEPGTLIASENGQISAGLIPQHRAILTVTQVDQTTFALPHTPQQPHLSELYINGEKAQFPRDYVIDGSTLTWHGNIALDASDGVELYYLL